jgi:hypothetical protein
MPGKARTPAPIDRPLSRAYLREFTGWSTAYPPGISEPTSLRLMENVQVLRDGAVRVRPGLKYLSYLSGSLPIDQVIVGTHEPFFLANGSKAYLFAVREDDDTVGFRVLANTGSGFIVQGLTAAGVEFTVAQGEPILNFTAATTYVKYLQIDNKIFALSNAGESMRYFTVGTTKTAKKLNAIERPAWAPSDKLTVVQPTQAWINSGVPVSTRINFLNNPSIEIDTAHWATITRTTLSRTTAQARPGGVASLRMETYGVDPIGVVYDQLSVSAGLDYVFSGYIRAATVAKTFTLTLRWTSPGGYIGSPVVGTPVADVNSSWTRLDVADTAPTGATAVELYLDTTANVSPGELHYLDDAMFEQATVVDTYFDGTFVDTSTEIYSWDGTPYDSDSRRIEYTAPLAVPTPAAPTGITLISTTGGDNVYNFGFFYTFANEVGESAPSQVTVVKAQRGWSQWRWELANANAEPSAVPTLDPLLCADQLVAYMPNSVFLDALDQGATKWHLYMMTWSDQDPVPVAAVRLSTRELVPGAAHGTYGYQRMTPQQADANAEVAALPSEVSRINYSAPSSAGNGVVAADRLVMVFDPAAAGVIRWSSNIMGSYSDFSSVRGGGYKTLSSGNLYVPAAVVLWQNPQSADTLTILCVGVDGRSTGYYMAPAQVASQSEAVNVMGFEETTATPGTVSPYGVEVVNNALYHPLDDQLMKSSATNYNINHMSLTDPIQNVWRGLVDKDHIISAVTDNRIYYLVHNPLGEDLEEGCWGNEVWVFDAQQKAGTWSRWLTQGSSLRRIDVDDRPVMSLNRPDGIYYFDEELIYDEYVDGVEVAARSIPWFLETNTQGANRAHDAWAHLQQVSIIVGNFLGSMRYGIRGLDIHGKMLTREKITRDDGDYAPDGTTFDLEDYLLVGRDMKEWFFFAGSNSEDDIVLPSTGQLSLVQYRYTPSTVNTGYQWGSVETFEYARAYRPEADRNTVNGVPMPFIDTGRP